MVKIILLVFVFSLISCDANTKKLDKFNELLLEDITQVSFKTRYGVYEISNKNSISEIRSWLINAEILESGGYASYPTPENHVLLYTSSNNLITDFMVSMPFEYAIIDFESAKFIVDKYPNIPELDDIISQADKSRLKPIK